MTRYEELDEKISILRDAAWRCYILGKLDMAALWKDKADDLEDIQREVGMEAVR